MTAAIAKLFSQIHYLAVTPEAVDVITGKLSQEDTRYMDMLVKTRSHQNTNLGKALKGAALDLQMPPGRGMAVGE